MSDPHEAERLAEQRLKDLDRGTERSEALAVERALAAERIAAHTAEQDRHLAEINGSVAETAVELKEIKHEVQKLRDNLNDVVREQQRRDSVNAALIAAGAASGTKRMARWQIISIAVMAFFALGSLMVAVVSALQASGHA